MSLPGRPASSTDPAPFDSAAGYHAAVSRFPRTSRRIALPLLAAATVGCGSEPEPAPTPDVPAAWSPPEMPAAADPASGPIRPIDEPPAPVVLPRDREAPLPDGATLAAAGLTRTDGKRLTIVSDRPERAEPLPALIDAVWPAWVDYFGAPPPARALPATEGPAPLMTALLMAEPDRFQTIGLLPDDLPPFLTGRQRGRRFWMYDVEEDYFRRSLTLHEATHVFMALRLPPAAGGRSSRGPLWYLEGMAELFGAHRLEPDGTLTVRVIPGGEAAAGGWDRIAQIRADVDAGLSPSVDEVTRLTDADFLEGRGYAWAWALCAFLDGHPAYTERFRSLGEPGRRGDLSVFAADWRRIDAEWRAFVAQFVPGHEVAANAVDFDPPPGGGPVSVAADRGWQHAGVRVKRGRRVTVSATGQFTLAEEPKPWESTAAGISFDYQAGRRLGELQATVLAEAPAAPVGFAEPIPVGANGGFVAPRAGVLYLRLNDRPDRRSDNRGAVAVTVAVD